MKEAGLIGLVLLALSAPAHAAPLPWRLGLSVAKTVYVRPAVNITLPIGGDYSGLDIIAGSQFFLKEQESDKTKLQVAMEYSMAYVSEMLIQKRRIFRFSFGGGIQRHPKIGDRWHYPFFDLTCGLTFKRGETDIYFDSLMRWNFIGQKAIYIGKQRVRHTSDSFRLGYNWWLG